jgi:hypothetical protein
VSDACEKDDMFRPGRRIEELYNPDELERFTDLFKSSCKAEEIFDLDELERFADQCGSESEFGRKSGQKG